MNYVFWLNELGDQVGVAQNLFLLLQILHLQHYNIIDCQTFGNVGI